jgi:hypothetical protein
MSCSKNEDVYFITDERLYDKNKPHCFKIGTSDYAIKRIYDLQRQETFLSEHFKCHKIIRNYGKSFENKTLERYLHKKFTNNRVCVNREWFHFTEEEFINFNLYIEQLISNTKELNTINYEKEHKKFMTKLDDNDILQNKDDIDINHISGKDYIKNRRISLIKFINENENNTIKYIKKNFKYTNDDEILVNYKNADIIWDMRYFNLIKH